MCPHCRGNIESSADVKKESDVAEDQLKKYIAEETEESQVMKGKPSAPPVKNTRAKKQEPARASQRIKVKTEPVVKQGDPGDEETTPKIKRTKKVWVGNGISLIFTIRL